MAHEERLSMAQMCITEAACALERAGVHLDIVEGVAPCSACIEKDEQLLRKTDELNDALKVAGQSQRAMTVLKEAWNGALKQIMEEREAGGPMEFTVKVEMEAVERKPFAVGDQVCRADAPAMCGEIKGELDEGYWDVQLYCGIRDNFHNDDLVHLIDADAIQPEALDRNDRVRLRDNPIHIFTVVNPCVERGPLTGYVKVRSASLGGANFPPGTLEKVPDDEIDRDQYLDLDSSCGD